MSTTIQGQLEINHARGVIYFHADPEAAQPSGHPVRVPTILRICGLPFIPEAGNDLIDVTCLRVKVSGNGAVRERNNEWLGGGA